MVLRPLHPGATTVLIVEDDPNDTLLEARALERFGIKQIHAVETAEQALDVLAKEPRDIVLVDYNLPGMDGLTLLERIRELQPNTRLVVVTGVRDEHLVVSAMKAGAVDFLCKDDLLTSGIIRSLQALLRARDAEKEERLAAPESSHVLESAITNLDWLLESFSGDATFSGRLTGGRYNDDLWTGALEALLRYVDEAFRVYPDTPRAAENQLIRMLVGRGSAPLEVLVLYGAALRSLLAAGVTPPMSPGVCLIRLLARLMEQYQTELSLEAVARLES
ncbi:MAG: response regulator [Dehalococcoidia bacterium]